jgi:hypothetical protein
MMSETIEFIGAEHVLAARGATKEISRRIIEICKEYEEHLFAAGQDCRYGQPSPGNKAGGLSTLEEKSLGCIHKGGTRPVVEVVMEGERPAKKGAVIMDSPAMTLLPSPPWRRAAASHRVYHGPGHADGQRHRAVIKVTGNDLTFRNMIDNMDFDASGRCGASRRWKIRRGRFLTSDRSRNGKKSQKRRRSGFPISRSTASAASSEKDGQGGAGSICEKGISFLKANVTDARFGCGVSKNFTVKIKSNEDSSLLFCRGRKI